MTDQQKEQLITLARQYTGDCSPYDTRPSDEIRRDMEAVAAAAFPDLEVRSVAFVVNGWSFRVSRVYRTNFKPWAKVLPSRIEFTVDDFAAKKAVAQ